MRTYTETGAGYNCINRSDAAYTDALRYARICFKKNSVPTSFYSYIGYSDYFSVG